MLLPKHYSMPWVSYMTDKQYNVLVLDMQPIDPPIGGGRLRLLGLYHNLGKGMQTTYVGTYDWPGEKYRDHNLSKSLREIDIPLSEAHFYECQKLQDKVDGKTIIDSTFHQFAYLSSDYVNFVRKEVVNADILIFSHPWIYPLVKDLLKKGIQLVVYDTHNVEGLLRTTLLDDGGTGTDLVKEVIKVEYELCHTADTVLACSATDRELFNRLYDVSFEKIKIVPNGVFTEKIKPVSQDEKERVKQEIGLGKQKVAIFIGSNYPPNAEAANYIRKVLCPQLPDVTFVIAGGVSEGIDKENSEHANNLKITGFLEERDKLRYLQAADFAINPMFSGSGTNIKMFDFMAAGLPVLTTAVGARGIEPSFPDAFKIYGKEEFVPRIKEIIENKAERLLVGACARKTVEEKYSWERISPMLGTLFLKFRDALPAGRPLFSVIIPTYERHALLFKVMDKLSRQTYRNFEVIVVDQSKDIWSYKAQDFDFQLFYIHTNIIGATKARNRGAFYAQGSILAFVDDDCLPSDTWLEKASAYFNRTDVVGVEGIIKSNATDSPDYRIVTNEGFEGIGFMTANLFVKVDTFNRLNGFDENFDNPHFREDTDFGWRALAYGAIPFAKDVEVFHPPHKRAIERESVGERNKFFEKDALLLKKHPEKYKELFLKEGHWKNTEGFWGNFLKGLQKYGVELPEFYKDLYKQVIMNGKATVIEGHSTPLPDPANKTTHLESNSAYHKTDKQLMTMVEELIEDDTKYFPPPTLSVTFSTKKEAIKLLNTLKGKLSGQSDDVKTYFDTSRQRYIFTLQVILEHKKKAIRKVLELGCSPGHLGMALDAMGMDVYGIDLNSEYLYKYPKSFVERLHIKQCNFENEKIPYADNTFDCIVFTEVLEHIAIQHPAKVLEEINRVLSPGGILIMSTPNVSNISNVFALMRGENIFWDPPIFYGSTDRHNREYTPGEVFSLLKGSGFQNIKIGYLNTPSNWNTKTADLTIKLLAEIPAITAARPLFLNTIFAKAEKS